MKSINFNEGLKKFCINDDESRVICFNPGDQNIMVRADKAVKRIEEYQKHMENIRLNPDGTPVDETPEAIQILEGFDDLVRKETNYIFNADVYDIAFAGQSPLSPAGNEFLFEAFYNVVIPMIKEETEAFNKAAQKRVEKYTKGYIK